MAVLLITLFVAVSCVAGLTVGKRLRFTASVAVPPHDPTTPDAEALYPFVVDDGLGHPGVFIGRTVPGGSEFNYDPFELYRSKTVTSANMVIAGEVGRGKSALVKAVIYRNLPFGRRAVVIDPKGEFIPLAEAMGGTVIRLAPGGDVVLNPLDAGDDMVVGETLAGITAKALNRDLTPEEASGLTVAWRHVQATRDNPTLVDVCEAMFRPTETQAAAVNSTPDALAAGTRDAALALWQMTQGDLAGMFDGPTNIDVDWDAPLIVIDLSELGATESKAMGVVMAAALAWLRPILTTEGGPQRLLVLDEAWHLLADRHLATWLRRNQKLSRKWGLANIFVIHRLSDLEEAGEDTGAVAWGLLADTQTQVFFSQKPADAELAKSKLHLSDAETDMLEGLTAGVCLFRVAGRSSLVRVRLSARERVITDTDAAMRHREQVR